MSCASSAARIEKGLSERNGVLKATVNFAAEKMWIEFDPERVHLLDLLVTIHELGYQVPVETVTIPIAGGTGYLLLAVAVVGDRLRLAGTRPFRGDTGDGLAEAPGDGPQSLAG
jgi:cation transport ATPase